MEDSDQPAQRVQEAATGANGRVQDIALAVKGKAGSGNEKVQEKIEDTAQSVKDRTELAKAKAALITERVAAGVSVAADHVAQAAADPEKRGALQNAVKEQIQRNPWAAMAGAFVVGVRVGRRLHWR